MPATRLILGPQGSHRNALIDALAAEHWGSFRLIVPSRAAARARAEALVRRSGKPGLWGDPVCDFHGFAEALVAGEGEAVRRLASFERRLLLEQCLATFHDHPLAAAFPGALDSPGVAAHLLRAISDLKQAAIEADEFQARVGGAEATPRDALVAAVYAAYQEALLASGAYDVPGLYWRADVLARAAKPDTLAGVDTLLFDGFDDFTPSEFRLIRSLAPHAEVLVFGLNHDERPGRGDLYALPARTAQRIRDTFDPVEIGCEAPVMDGCRSYAAAHLAWRDVPPGAEDLAPDLALVPCIDDTHEVERAGRRIKGLIAEQGVAPSDIALVFRSDNGIGAAARRVFGEYGIPLRAAAPALFESGLARTWLKFFEASAAWEREAVVELLASPWLHLEGISAEARAAASHLARRAQIIGGLHDWRRGLTILGERIARGKGDDIRALLERLPEAGRCVEELTLAIETLAAAAFPARATRRRYAALLDTRVAEWSATAASASPEESAALSGLYALIAGFMERGEDIVEREIFVRHFEQGLRDATYTVPALRDGVALLDAQAIRNLRFGHVFFIGVNENAVPAPPKASALWPERDRTRLRAAGIPLENALEHGERELLLFHHVLSAARTRIEISWHLQKDGGREAAPSPYIAELRELFRGRDDVLQPSPVADLFLAAPEDVASPRDLRVAAMHYAPPLQKDFAEIFRPLIPGLLAEAERHDNQPAGIYDGVLRDASLRGTLDQHYGADHCYSVAQLERYVACPFQFFQERVLRIDDTEAPEDAFDNRVRGTILHEALQAFHAAYAGVAAADMPEDEARQALHDALDAAFTRHDWKCRAAPRGVRAVEHRRMRRMLDRYFDDERRKGDARFKPAHFEASFGPARGEPGDGLANSEPFIIETETGPVALAGRIDRIDVAEGSVQLIDYKSGGVPSASDIKAGYDLQLSVYAQAARNHLLPDFLCGAAYYVGLGKGKRQEALMLDKVEVAAEREEKVRDAIAGAVRGIRAGRFPPRRIDPKKCYGCGQAHACRYAEARMAQKPL